MSKTTETAKATIEVAKAVIDTAFDILKSEGLGKDAARLASDLRHELSQREGIIRATLVTPSGKAGDFAEIVRKALEKKLDREVELVERADTSLLGGAILEYGDSRIDLSIRGALDEARAHLVHASH